MLEFSQLNEHKQKDQKVVKTKYIKISRTKEQGMNFILTNVHNWSELFRSKLKTTFLVTKETFLIFKFHQNTQLSYKSGSMRMDKLIILKGC